MERKVLMRVPAMVPWPRHSTLEQHPASKAYKKPTRIGEMMLTLGQPKTPSHHWDCGTDMLWPVLEINGTPLDPNEHGKYPYVCRHQIVAGD